MITTTADPLTTLAASLEAHVAGAKADLTRFPSGGAMLDIRRSDGRVFVLAFAPAHGYGVDEVRAEDGLVASYRFTYSDLAPAAQKLRELVSGLSEGNAVHPPIALNLVVVQARDLEAAKQFYECLGLILQPEKHGHGPDHFSAQIGSTVFEVYPCRDDSAGGQVRIGFEVDALQPAMDALQRLSAKILTEPRESPWGLRAVVEDPSGNRVELIERR